MKHTLLHTCAIFAVAAFLLAACAPDVKHELYMAEGLSATKPDSTFAILDNIDRENLPDEECRQLYDLAWAEAYYISNRDVTDSIYSVLSRMETIPGTRQHLARKILHSIYRYRQNDMDGAFAGFDSCRQLSDVDIHPYWKAVVEDYMGIICIHSGLWEQCHGHFHKVLEYAQLIGDRDIIANAHSHLCLYYRCVDKLDTAMYYASKVVENCDGNDSKMLAIAYNNLASMQMALSAEDYSSVLDILRRSRQFAPDAEKSMNTSSMIARVFYSMGKPDSAYIYQVEVEQSNHTYAKYNLYRFLSDYYGKTNSTDSAYKYLKLYTCIESTLQSNKPTEQVLNTIHRRDRAETVRHVTRLHVLISMAAVFIILTGVALLLYRYKGKMAIAGHRLQETLAEHRQMQADYSQVEQERQHAMEEMGFIRKRLHDTKSELHDSNAELSRANKKIEHYQKQIGKKNLQLVEANRTQEKYKLNLETHSHTIIRDFLDKSKPFVSETGRAQIDFLIGMYAASGKSRQHFVRSLSQYVGTLTPNGRLICILYNEGFTDGEIIAKLQTNSRNFRAIKYRARKAINNSGNENTEFIKQLLGKFERNK